MGNDGIGYRIPRIRDHVAVWTGSDLGFQWHLVFSIGCFVALS
jgi:hypothetical protein